MQIIEQFVASKTGNMADCADFVAATANHIAVFDGRTAKSDWRWNGESGGRLAARTLADQLDQLPVDCDAVSACDFFNRMLVLTYETLDIDPGTRELTTSAAVFSASRREVWLIGDCQALLDDDLVENTKPVDALLADIRSLVLELKLIDGVSQETLREADAGRQFIMPILKMQHFLQNNMSATFGYAVLDGSPVQADAIKVRALESGCRQIVLASDGYPELRPTLADSESRLTAILADDPLLFRRFRSTKGLAPGNESFDDRAYVRFRPGEEN